MEKGFSARDITCRLLLVEGGNGPSLYWRGRGLLSIRHGCTHQVRSTHPHSHGTKAQRLFIHQDGTASSTSRHEVLQELFAGRIQGTLLVCR